MIAEAFIYETVTQAATTAMPPGISRPKTGTLSNTIIPTLRTAGPGFAPHSAAYSTLSNRDWKLLETSLTQTKQNTEGSSNRDKIEGSSKPITRFFDSPLVTRHLSLVTCIYFSTRYNYLLETPATETKQTMDAISTRYKMAKSFTRNQPPFRSARRRKKNAASSSLGIFSSRPAPQITGREISDKTFSTSHFLTTILYTHGPGTSQLSRWLRVRMVEGNGHLEGRPWQSNTKS
jgi:hypothetical protein